MTIMLHVPGGYRGSQGDKLHNDRLIGLTDHEGEQPDDITVLVVRCTE